MDIQIFNHPQMQFVQLPPSMEYEYVLTITYLFYRGQKHLFSEKFWFLQLFKKKTA